MYIRGVLQVFQVSSLKIIYFTDFEGHQTGFTTIRKGRNSRTDEYYRYRIDTTILILTLAYYTFANLDDTYMYDDDVRMLAPSAVPQSHDPRLGHWYDEPPYESDPEDFLMGGGGQATIQVRKNIN